MTGKAVNELFGGSSGVPGATWTCPWCVPETSLHKRLCLQTETNQIALSAAYNSLSHLQQGHAQVISCGPGWKQAIWSYWSPAQEDPFSCHSLKFWFITSEVTLQEPLSWCSSSKPGLMKCTIQVAARTVHWSTILAMLLKDDNM